MAKSVKPHLYALLVGVDQYPYPVRPLKGCVNDIRAFSDYLERAEKDNYQLHIEKLENTAAKKGDIIRMFQEHLGKAGKQDVALFYYSGHGAQEAADTRIWTFEPDGKLEGLVCYDSIPGPQGPFNLLVDKELRYLINKLGPEDKRPHVVTIFDCCHSGDNTRNIFIGEEDREVRERQFRPADPRMGTILPVRDWKLFAFSKEISSEQVKNCKVISDVLPEGRHIQLSACASDESSYEVGGSGIFSKNLIQVLERSQGGISYYDLSSRLRTFIKGQYQQTPQVYEGGGGNIDLYKSFLNRSDTGKPLYGNVTYNPKEGWLFDMGVMHGISPQAKEITVFPHGKPREMFTAKIADVRPADTLLTLPETTDKAGVYQGFVDGFFSAPIRVFIQNQDLNLSAVMQLRKMIERKGRNVLLADKEAEADYTVNVYQERYVITRAGDPFRPLALPADDLGPESLDETFQNLRQISQWEYVRQLHNDGTNHLPQDSVKLEVTRVLADGREQVLTWQGDELMLEPEKGDYDGTQYGVNLRLSITNTSTFPVHVSLLFLSSTFGITGSLLANKVEKLAPKSAGEARGGQVQVLDGDDLVLPLGKAAWVFNMPQHTQYLKLIASRQPFNVNLLEQEPMADPARLAEAHRGKGDWGFGRKERNASADAWMTRTLALKLKNPQYNKIFAADLQEWMGSAAAPFVYGLYLDQQSPFGGKFRVKEGIELVEGKDALGRGLFFDIKLAVANWVSQKMRQRQFVQIIKKFPNRVRVVSEGDSWFQHPDPRVKDIIDHLFNQYAVYSLDSAGDRLRHYFQAGDYAEALALYRPEFLLLSGGGNDILGEQFKDYLRSDFATNIKQGQQPERFLQPTCFKEIDALGDIYQTLLHGVLTDYPTLHILVHGYDYIIPLESTREGWLGRYMIEKGIEHQADRKAVVDLIIDRFNTMLGRIAAKFPNVHYIDLRGTVRADLWWDEIHPNSQGFQDVAIKFQQKIDELRKPGPGKSRGK
ncbi:MAG: caspase family protein [Lewinellaceae bacterium]|nr:caspase family protein [Lewinellaceae bacterium]